MMRLPAGSALSGWSSTETFRVNTPSNVSEMLRDGRQEGSVRSMRDTFVAAVLALKDAAGHDAPHVHGGTTSPEHEENSGHVMFSAPGSSADQKGGGPEPLQASAPASDRLWRRSTDPRTPAGGGDSGASP